MKIILRSFWRKDAEVDNQISRDLLLSGVIEPSSTSFEFDADTEAFQAFLNITAFMPDGCWFQPVLKFSKHEIDQSKIYQLDCRGRLVKETRADEEFNLQNLRTTEMLTTGKFSKIKLVKKIALSKINLPPNVIGGTALLEEFVMSEHVANVFERFGLSGFSKIPIFNLRNMSDHIDFFQPYTESIMPLSSLNISTLVRETEKGNYSYRELGCLTYSSEGIEKAKDFNRTAENWASNNMPIWIVTSKTKKCYDDNNLKGWHFRPVLQEGSPLHAEYLERWNNLFIKISTNPKNRIS